jgi:hypothetical protein
MTMKRCAAFLALAALLAPVAVSGQDAGDRLDEWRDSWGYWALQSQREMAIDEPISNVMHIEAHNAYNSTAYDAFRVVPTAGPNQVLRIDEQLAAGARAIELDVHQLEKVELEICLTDNPVSVAKRIRSAIVEPLAIGIDVPDGGGAVAPFALAVSSLDSIIVGEVDDFGDVVGVLGGLFELLGEKFLEAVRNFGCVKVDICMPGFVAQDFVPQICSLPGEFGGPTAGDLFVGHESADDFGSPDFLEAHGITLGFPVPVNGERKYKDAVDEIAGWLKREGNEKEVVLIDLEDGTHLFFMEAKLRSVLQNAFQEDGSSMIYTPLDRLDGRWPTRNEMLALGKRVVIFDSRGRSFGDYMNTTIEASRRFDGASHTYNGSFLTFRRDSGDDPGWGNWFESGIKGYLSGDADAVEAREEQPDNEDQFFAVNGDGLTFLKPPPWANSEAGNDPIRSVDAIELARNNVNLLKMDFLLGADIGILETLEYRLPQGLPGGRLRNAVWSWQENDGGALRARGDLDNILAKRDFVSQFPDSRWISTPSAPDDGRAFRYACISADRVPVPRNGKAALLEYLWRITERSGPWIEGNDACREQFEQVDVGDGQTARFVFAGPVNGHRNFAIQQARLDADALHENLWLNVNDADQDGSWLVNRSALALVSPASLSVPEGTDGRATAPTLLSIESLAVADGDGQVLLDGVGSFDPDEELRPEDALRDFAWSWSYADPKLQGIEPSEGSFDVAALDPAFPDDGVTTVELLLTDGHLGGHGRDLVPVTVTNVDPETGITSVADETGAEVADKLGVAIEGLVVSLEASFSDAGRHDTHETIVDWRDGTVDETDGLDRFVPTTDGEGGELAASHPYLLAGQYEIRVTVTDDDAGTGSDVRQLEVIAAAEAMERGAGLLAELLADPATSAEEAESLERALRLLLGNRMGLGGNGAFDLLAGGEWNAGLLKLVRAMRAVEAARDAGLSGDARFERAVCFLALGAKSVTAKQLLLLVNEQDHPQSVAAEASALVASADALRNAGELAEATDLYRLAQRAIQGFTVPGP